MKVKSTWTYESNQDLRAMHNVDAEQELTDLIAAEISAEIDREILNDLRALHQHPPMKPMGYYNPPVETVDLPIKKAKPTARDITDEWQPSMTWTEEVYSEPI